MKKRVLASLLVLVIATGLISCGNKNEAKNDEKKPIGVLTLDNSSTSGVKDVDRIDPKNFNFEFSEEDKKQMEGKEVFKHYDNLTSAILGLDRGDVSLIALPEPVSDYIMKQNKNKYQKVRIGREHVVLVMAAMKDKKDIIDEINVGLKTIMSNHKYDEIYKKYILYGNTDSTEKLPHFDDAKTIKIAVTGDLPPFDYTNAAGEAQGFNVAILSALSDAMHVNFELVNCEAGSRAITAASGKADVIFWMSGNSKDENGQKVDFSEDVPENMAVSDRYAIVPRTLIFLDSDEKMKEHFKDHIIK